jgi:hypothetical protein
LIFVVAVAPIFNPPFCVLTAGEGPSTSSVTSFVTP